MVAEVDGEVSWCGCGSGSGGMGESSGGEEEEEEEEEEGAENHVHRNRTLRLFVSLTLFCASRGSKYDLSCNGGYVESLQAGWKKVQGWCSS